MSTILLLTRGTSTDVLPSLGLLTHPVLISPPEASALLDTPEGDAILVDARRDLLGARDLCRLIRTTGAERPLFAVVTEGGLAAVNPDWQIDDVLVDTAGPAEVEARLRLAAGNTDSAGARTEGGETRAGELTVDENTYLARLRGAPLDLTFKEFELLRYLAQHPGRVFTRTQLLQEVWGYDYFGGTRTVDVHIRRLRAKFGAEHESMIGTVRGVGYRFVLPGPPSKRNQPRGGPQYSPHSASKRSTSLGYSRSTKA